MRQGPARVYLHGCAVFSSRRGGWAVVLRHGAQVRIRAGGPYRTVSAPRMQVLSLASALLALRRSEWTPDEIILYSPCEYIVDNVPRVRRWLRQGRLRPHDGNAVKHADVWRQVVYRLNRLPPVRCVRLAEGVDLDQQRAIGLARYRARMLGKAK